MLKAQLNFQVQATTAAAVRSRADEVNANLGDLGDLLLRYALTHISTDTLREWARKQESRKGCTSGALRRDERSALGALERMTEAPVFRLELEDIADEAGLPRRDAFRALKSLQARGLVTVWSQSAELDRWDRPVKSIWQINPLPSWAGKPLPPPREDAS